MIAFRVDANEHIASGHLMRCMSLAAELRKQGEECVFYMADDNFTERLEQQGFAYQILHTDWKNLEQELPLWTSILEGKDIRWLIVDSYQVTSEYLRKLNQMVKVCYIDDMEKQCWQVSAVIHYLDWLDDAHYSEKYQGMDTLVMTGMEYAPLREEFYYHSEGKPEKKILLTTGGTDPYNVAGRVLEKAMVQEELSDYSFQVIVGAMNGFKEELRSEYAGNRRVKLFFDVKNMGDLMRGSSCAVSAGGTTLLELCACSVPTVCFSFAENQEDFARTMGDKCIMVYAGDAREEKNGVGAVVDGIVKGIKKMVGDEVLRERLRGSMRKLVDGRGVERIVKKLLF